MSLLRLLGLGIVAILLLVTFGYMLLSIALYTHEPGVSHRLLKCIFGSLPFLVLVALLIGASRNR
jgi:hypothetical protein